MAKFGMSMCVLGMHEELKPYNIAVNALWPKTAIWTSAMEMLSAGFLYIFLFLKNFFKVKDKQAVEKLLLFLIQHMQC